MERLRHHELLVLRTLCHLSAEADQPVCLHELRDALGWQETDFAQCVDTLTELEAIEWPCMGHVRLTPLGSELLESQTPAEASDRYA